MCISHVVPWVVPWVMKLCAPNMSKKNTRRETFQYWNRSEAYWVSTILVSLLHVYLHHIWLRLNHIRVSIILEFLTMIAYIYIYIYIYINIIIQTHIYVYIYTYIYIGIDRDSFTFESLSYLRASLSYLRLYHIGTSITFESNVYLFSRIFCHTHILVSILFASLSYLNVYHIWVKCVSLLTNFLSYSYLSLLSYLHLYHIWTSITFEANVYLFSRIICHTFFDGYCSTVQGLLDWFEVDLGSTKLLFIQTDLCVMCVLSLLTNHLSYFSRICTPSSSGEAPCDR